MTGFKHLVAGSLVCVALAARADERGWFDVSFADYAQGQALTAVGASGGAWAAPISASATNVHDGVRNGIAVQTTRIGDVRFEPFAPSASGDVERIDFGMCPEEIFEDVLPDLDGAAGVSAALIGGAPVFVGVTADGWTALHGDGVAPAVGVWFDGRIELRTVDGLRLVSYLIKKGEDYVRLADAAGATWFRTTAPRAEGGVESVSFAGNGRFSDFGGREDDGEAVRVFRWTGGASGDWNDVANWTTNGVAAGIVPGAAGDVAVVDGAVSLTNGTEVGTVSNLTIGFGEDGEARRMGGGLETAISLDTSRPRAGRAISATFDTFLGLQPTYSFAWRRGSTAKKYDAGFVGDGASYTPTAADYDHWFMFTAYGEDGAVVLQKEFFFSKLPVLYLTTDDGATPSANKETHDGWLFAQGNDEWKSLYDGAMEIKVRGNTTSSYPKKPWKIKLGTKTAMFGIPKSKHWVLLANYNDQSMLRNKLAYDFANDIGSLGMKSTWVECVLNGTWQGTYQFCEHIRIAKERVNVHDWEGDAGDIAEAFAKAHGLTDDQEDALATQLEQNLSWVTSDSFTFATNGVTLTGQPSALLKKFTDDITGGYLFEFSNEYDETSKFTTTSGRLALKTMLKNPEYLRTNPEMFGYCQTFLQNYWDACTSIDGYSTEGKYIGAYCDFESMVNYWLAMELFGNNDAVYKSRYGYKGQGEKFAFGPVWDFDWGVGSVRVSTNAEEWKCQDRGVPQQAFFKEWSDNPEFCTRLFVRYWQVRGRFASCIAEGGLIDQATNYLNEACCANSARWDPVHDKKYNLGAESFAADVARLRTYLTQRLAWLDQQFADVPTLMASLRGSTSTNPYTPDADTLPIAFSNLNRRGNIPKGRRLNVEFTVGGSTAATISCFVNGVRVVDRQGLDGNRAFRAAIPSGAFTAALGEPNCVAFIAYDSSGTVVARNYALVTQAPSESTTILLR